MVAGPKPIVSFALRLVTEADEAFLFRLYGTTRAVEMDAAGFPDARREAFLQMQFNAQRVHYHKFYPAAKHLLVLVEERAAGRMWIDRSEPFIHLLDIAILPEFRNLGLGAALLNGLIAESEQSRLPIGVYVETNNPAQSFYRRLGFSLIKDEELYLYFERQPSGGRQ